ncbi:hypothetical protein BH11MYX1_BH11MYX1_36550 [soil metagenome]
MPGHDSVTDHNIYVNSEGTGPDGGLIARNIFYGAYNGSQIKGGSGGVADAPSGNNIAIEYNTMHHATRHVVLFGHHMRNITLNGNLEKAAEGRSYDRLYRDGISLQQLEGTHTVNAHDNYVHDADFVVGFHALAPGAYAAPSPDTNRLFTTAATEPHFNSSGCGDGSPGTGPPTTCPRTRPRRATAATPPAATDDCAFSGACVRRAASHRACDRWSRR